MSKGEKKPHREAVTIAEEWQEKWLTIEPNSEHYFCGSIRRQEDMVGDIDVLIVDAGLHGLVDNRGSFGGMQLNLFWTKPECLGAGMLFLTGCGAFNIRMRARAKRMGFKLNRYGLHDRKTGETFAALSEVEIFQQLNLKYILPWRRRAPNGKDHGIQIDSTTPGGSYEVFTIGIHGFNHCECKGFFYRGECRHLVEAELLL